jgi:AraC-like DNA-binding protein
MLTKELLAASGGFRIHDVRCRSARSPWTSPEPTADYAVVFVRRGCFRRRVGGSEMLVDPTVVYFERPGQEQEVAHPRDGGDSCTYVSVSPELLATIREGAPIPHGPVTTSAALDLAHRLLLASVRRSGDGFELSERLVRLVDRILHGVRPERGLSRGADGRRRAAVDAAREAILDDPGIDLIGLARRVSYSPHHLSRVFSLYMGEPISRYRNRVRIRLALERLAGGEPCLARLAVELGFSDHAHLTREMRAQLGAPPSALRNRLAA